MICKRKVKGRYICCITNHPQILWVRNMRAAWVGGSGSWSLRRMQPAVGFGSSQPRACWGQRLRFQGGSLTWPAK